MTGSADDRADEGAAIWRVFGYLVCAVVIVAVAWPFSWPRGRDSFPLSSYPMFSRRLPDPTFSGKYALAIERDGTRHHLSPDKIANAEVLQAQAVLSRAVRQGPSRVHALCRRIAERVARDAALAAAVQVRIVTGRHDAVAYLTGSDRVGKEKIHGRCAVPRERTR